MNSSVSTVGKGYFRVTLSGCFLGLYKRSDHAMDHRASLLYLSHFQTHQGHSLISIMNSTTDLETDLAPFLGAESVITHTISSLSVGSVYNFTYYPNVDHAKYTLSRSYSFYTVRVLIRNLLKDMPISSPITGIYCVVFGVSICVLSRPGSPAHRLYTGCSITLFVLTTIYTTVNTWGTSREVLYKFRAATTKNYGPFVQYLKGDNGKTAWM